MPTTSVRKRQKLFAHLLQPHPKLQLNVFQLRANTTIPKINALKLQLTAAQLPQHAFPRPSITGICSMVGKSMYRVVAQLVLLLLLPQSVFQLLANITTPKVNVAKQLHMGVQQALCLQPLNVRQLPVSILTGKMAATRLLPMDARQLLHVYQRQSYTGTSFADGRQRLLVAQQLKLRLVQPSPLQHVCQQPVSISTGKICAGRLLPMAAVVLQ